MNKDSIYKIIGYNGEYNTNIKKNIRKLLKENHPDNNGDQRIFELINEVKEELENNKVSYSIKDTVKEKNYEDFIDYNYCAQMIEKTNKKIKIYARELDDLKKKQKKYNDDYYNNYRDSIDLETYLLANSQYTNELKRTKYTSIIILILTIITFTISVWKKDLVFFIIFTILVIVCVIIVHKSFTSMQKITQNSRNKISSYVKLNNKLRDSTMKQDELKKEINEVNKKINNLNNDLRFYKNILDDR